MSGFSFTKYAATLAVLSTVFLASLADASTSPKELFRAQAGCMSCHQGGAVQTDKTVGQHQETPSHKNRIKA